MTRTMWRGAWVAGLLSAALVAACGGGDDGDGGGGVEGTLNLSGGFSGSSAQMVATAAHLNATNATTIGFSAAISGSTTTTAGISFTVSGSFADGTYDLSSSELVIGSVSQGGGAIWQIQGGSDSGGSNIGSASVTITGTGSAVNSSAGVNYYGIHGTFTATFKAQQGSSTDVTATGTF